MGTLLEESLRAEWRSGTRIRRRSDKQESKMSKRGEYRDDDNEVAVEMDVDDALENAGPCGISQTLLQLLFMTACVTVCYHAIESYFTGHSPAWECVLDLNTTNTSTGQDIDTRISQRSSEWISFCLLNANASISSDDKDFYRRCEMHRNEWRFTTDSSYSFVTEFDLVCDRSAVSAFASGSLFLGGLLGCLIAGIIGDTYGRKSVMIASQALCIVSSLACSYSANIWQLTAFRVMLGGSQMACYALGYTALLEFIAPSYRTLCGMLYQMMFCASQMFIDLVAYFCREWRVLQFYSSFACALPLFLFFLTPNSPRWLTSQGNHTKAVEILRKLANINGNPLPNLITLKSSEKENIEEKTMDKNEKTSYTYFHLFKTWKLFYTTSILSFIWITCALLYFAIALESSNLGGNMYQAFAFTAVADMPSYFTALFACSHFGRKRTVLGSLLFAGVFIGALALVPQTYEHKYIINISLSMLGKFCTTNAFNSIFLWTFEIYPTVLRSQGSSYCVAWERFGALGAPFLITVLQKVSFCLPYVIMSVCSFACVFVGLVLPETKDRPTREKYEDFFDDVSTKKKEVRDAEITGCDNKGLEHSNSTGDTHV